MVARSIWLSRAAIIGQALFTTAWILGGLLQDSAYSTARHDISDLGALTAQRAWVYLVPQGIAGALTMAFAIGALRPALSTAGHGDPVSAWLVAFSLMGLDNLTDTFFRLDCRAADAGCTAATAAASWHGMLHVIIGVATALVTLAAPFALARRMRLVRAWRDLASGAVVFGVLFVLLTVAYIALNASGVSGYMQRASGLLISAGMIILARRVQTVALAGEGVGDNP